MENIQDFDSERPAAARASDAKPKRGARKGAPPPRGDTLGALADESTPGGRRRKSVAKPAKTPAKERTEPLNFRVTPDFRRAFKCAAADQDCKKVELLERMFAEWSARNPA